MSTLVNIRGFIAAIAFFLIVSLVYAESPSGQKSSDKTPTAEAADGPATDGGSAPRWTGDPDMHPLMPALSWAKEELRRIEKIDNYTAKLVKRERIGGKLASETLSIKVRQEPFSIYAKSLAPPSEKGQEALYVDGENDGKMWAHSVGVRALLGTLSIEPSSALAMDGERYPLTQIGFLKLTQRLIEVAENDLKYDECTVRSIDGAKINGRLCRCIEVVHPQPRENFLFHIARIYVDDQLNLPIRYEGYGWPSAGGDKPPLIEEYTYLDIKLDAGLTAADFDVHNPAYHFNPADGDVAAREKAGMAH